MAETGQFWSDMIMPALDVLASLPAERVLQLSYEDLAADPRQALLRLVRFADLPHADPGWLDSAVQLVERRSPLWLALPQEQIDELTRVCEPAMRRPYRGSWWSRLVALLPVLLKTQALGPIVRRRRSAARPRNWTPASSLARRPAAVMRLPVRLHRRPWP